MKPGIAGLAIMLAAGIAGAAAADPARWARDWPQTDFTRSTIDLVEIVSGGPPKDGIPAIHEPAHIPVAQETRLEMDDREPVLTYEGDGYPSGEDRGGSGLTVALHGDHLDEVFNAERGEREDLELCSAVDPDDAVFRFHSDGEVMEAIDCLAEFCRDALDGFDGMDLVQLHVQAT